MGRPPGYSDRTLRILHARRHRRPPPARFRDPPLPRRPRRHARARLRQSAARPRLDRPLSLLRGPHRDGQAPARPGAHLRHPWRAHAFRARGHDRRDRGRHALPDRLHRARRHHHAAARFPRRRRSLPDAGLRLRPGAHLRRRHARAHGRGDQLLPARDRRSRARPAHPPQHQRALSGKPGQPHLRGAGRPGPRRRGARGAGSRC